MSSRPILAQQANPKSKPDRLHLENDAAAVDELGARLQPAPQTTTRRRREAHTKVPQADEQQVVRSSLSSRVAGRSQTTRNNHEWLISGKPNGYIYSINSATNLLLGAHRTASTTTTTTTATTTRYNRNISLMRSILVNYLKLTLCSCYDTLALANLLVFVLFLNTVIEAHQHRHQHQGGNNQHQTTRRLAAGLRVGQLYWNRTSAGGSMAALARSAANRARRSAEGLHLRAAPSGGLFTTEDNDLQQRQLLDLDALPVGAETLLAAVGSELRPLIAAVEPGEPSGHFEISRVTSAVKTNNVSAIQTTTPQQYYYQLHHEQARSQHIDKPLASAMDRATTDRPNLASARNNQGSQQQQQQRRQQVTHAHTTHRPAQASEHQTETGPPASALDRVPDWSFRQAVAPKATTAQPSTTTERPRPGGGGPAAPTPKSRLAMEGSHWIPITRTATAASALNGRPAKPDRLIVTASSQAASALLDYPPKHVAGPPAHWPQAHHRQRPELQQLGSYSYGDRGPFVELRPPVPRAPLGPSYELTNQHQHQHQHHHNHYHQHHQHHQHHNHHWPRRRPRFQGELDNELGPMPPPMRPSKIYKRVLLCDKTLVSLDYIRNWDLEPRPSQAGGQMLNEHEINEINDHFLDMETSLESSMARLSLALNGGVDSNMIRRSIASNSTGPISGANKLTNGTAAEPETRPATNETVSSADQLAAAMSVTMPAMERRHWRHNLLPDEDPLVRCDMWDLEKGLKSRKPPEAILRMAIKSDFDTVRDAINRCRQLSGRTLPPDDEYRDGLEIMSTEDLISLFSMKRGLMPGTKWCGLGDQADSYNDLGPKHRIDICCRAHDHCPIRSKPFRNDYGILNIGLYTKSHCDCDADFYRCLREVRSRTADMLGNLYFNVMKLQCMREERLKVCREMKPIALGFERCVRYEESPVKTVFKFTTPPVAY